MILFLNVYLTEIKFGTRPYVRQNAKYSDKVDTFKYMLSSLVDLYPWKKVIINCKLDDFYKPRTSELFDFIHQNFDKYPLVLKNYRNEYQKDWKDDYSLIDDDMIFFSCNHDHIFIEPDREYFYNIVEKYRNFDNYLGIHYSHWQENCFLLFNSPEVYDTIKIYDDHFTINCKESSSLYIINKKTYHHWWCEYDLEGLHFPRSEGLVTKALHSFWWFQPMTLVYPYREFFRHFDAYSHNPWVDFTNEKIPVVEIPDGFFENNVKINYSTKYLEGYTNINPLNSNLKIYNPNGTDFNFPKELIPFFWKDKISEFNDELKFLSALYPREHIYKSYVSKIVNLWNNIPNNQSENGTLLKNKVIEWYMKLFK